LALDQCDGDDDVGDSDDNDDVDDDDDDDDSVDSDDDDADMVFAGRGKQAKINISKSLKVDFTPAATSVNCWTLVTVHRWPSALGN
jgi:hypothetical protein